MDTVKIRFNTTRVVADEHEGTSRETRFEAGATYSLEPRSADRWVKRGVAEFVSADDAAKAEGASAAPAVKLLDPSRQSGGKKEPSPKEEKGGQRAAQNAGDGEGQGGTGEGAEPVDIPANWQTLHHATKKKLAREISGEEPADTEAAEAVIEAEVARRASEQIGS